MNEVLRPMRLMCEGRTDPVGIVGAKPVLSWSFGVSDSARALAAKGFQVLVARDLESLARHEGNLWESGTVQSNASTTSYGGSPLGGAQHAWWKVRSFDVQNNASLWSAPAHWIVGLEPGDWAAKWIGVDPATYTSTALPLFRKSFTLDKPITRATVFFCGLGQHELHLNGQPVGEDLVDPGWTNYKKTCLYASHDVTSLLKQGGNAIGLMLGNGMYSVLGQKGRYRKFTGSFGPLKLIAQLHVTHADASTTIIASDSSWKASPGPITFTCIYGGEDYDARLEQKGWTAPDFDDSKWTPAALVDGPGGELRPQLAPPIREQRRYESVRVDDKPDGKRVYDLGQNFSGSMAIEMNGPAGASVKLRTGELLDEYGQVSQRSSGAGVWYTYTKRSEGTETWQPRFTFTGFRYVGAEGDLAALKSLEGRFTHSSAPVVGQFKCSSDFFNRIHELILMAIRSNMQSVFTDCPHREKLGWLEQTQLMASAILFNFDAAALFDKVAGDIRDSQLEDGTVPTTAPQYTVFGKPHDVFNDSPEWGAAAVLNPWFVYQKTGDLRIVTEHYGVMKRFVDYLQSRAGADGIVAYGLSDWYDIGPGDPGHSKLTTLGVTGTATLFQCLKAMETIATRLEKSDDAKAFADRAETARVAFNRKFFDEAAKHYDKGSQCAQAMPLALDIADEAHRSSTLDALVAGIRATNNHITAGDIGFRYVLMALVKGGRSDVIVDLLSRMDPPSYGSQLAAGATALTEAWDANPKNSQNHFMLGHAEAWFYEGLAGFDVDLSREGAQRIVIRPSIVGDLTWVEASYLSRLGPIAVRWDRQGNRLTLRVDVPVNASATIWVPSSEPESVHEGTTIASKAQGVRSARVEKNFAVLEVQSGRYTFESSL